MPTFTLYYTDAANTQLDLLEKDKSAEKQFKAVRKALGLLEMNPRHPSLNTHKHEGLSKLHGEDIFEAYAQNKTPVAYRIFWKYGPEKGNLTIIAITPHP